MLGSVEEFKMIDKEMRIKLWSLLLTVGMMSYVVAGVFLVYVLLMNFFSNETTMYILNSILIIICFYNLYKLVYGVINENN